MLAYLHIPYCDSKCHYCAFNSYVGRFDTRPAYMAALRQQLVQELARFRAGPHTIETLFIGGGTPSTVSAELYGPIFELLTPYLVPDAEITVEANPNSASRAWLSGMQALGVTRVSFGVQSFNVAKLKILGRAHTARDAVAAIHAAAEAGIPHRSLDLIYNVRGDTRVLLAADIEHAMALPIDHLSAYELTLEPGTPFAADPDTRRNDDALAFFVAREITRRGFDQYEVSNFGHYRSRHNLGYWALSPYIGAGAGAVGYRQGTRYYPATDIDTYLRDPLNVRIEHLDADARRTERLFLGWRSRIGVSAAHLTATMQARADVLVAAGKLTRQDGRYHNPNLFLADEVTLFVLG